MYNVCFNGEQDDRLFGSQLGIARFHHSPSCFLFENCGTVALSHSDEVLGYTTATELLLFRHFLIGYTAIVGAPVVSFAENIEKPLA